ncbi:16S rRNA (adenine(1518)-N(6)/adenine(1519)-N(6))-dimethyltransferase RsmA [Mycoplasma sp. 5370]
MNKEIRAKKQLGQNFLIDKNIINKIIEIANVENKEIIEIGPGQGALTEILVSKAKHLTAFEIDNDMIEILKNKITSKNFNLIHNDFLKEEISFDSKKEVVANLPYYITSKILFKIFENINSFSKLTIMVQDEVAQRIVSKNNKSEYGKLSVSCQFLADVTKEFIVPPTCFFPKPKVNSAIITLKIKENLDQNYVNEFLEFVKLCFSMKRKTLYNNLKNKFPSQDILNVFKENNILENTRPQELNWQTFEKIFKSFYRKG